MGICGLSPETEALIPRLDSGIARAVAILREAGVETFESCEGGPDHPYPEPAVRFHGQHTAGFRALGIALEARLPVYALRRYWGIEDGEPVGPYWELVFSQRMAPVEDAKG